VKLISEEPYPTGAADPGRWNWLSQNDFKLPKPRALCRDFSEVLTRRNSATGSASITVEQLSTILWHSCLIRERRAPVGQLRGWESRNAPSAGGLYELEILCLPFEQEAPTSWYDPLGHRLIPIGGDLSRARDEHRQVLQALCNSTVGVTLQFVADWQRISTVYSNASSLVWRNAGALLTTFCLVAEAADVACTALGRKSVVTGITPSDQTSRWWFCGGVHLSGRAA
jgi:SagB-type dehydrogenase family enzyme